MITKGMRIVIFSLLCGFKNYYSWKAWRGANASFCTSFAVLMFYNIVMTLRTRLFVSSRNVLSAYSFSTATELASTMTISFLRSLVHDVQTHTAIRNLSHSSFFFLIINYLPSLCFYVKFLRSLITIISESCGYTIHKYWYLVL